MLTSVLAILVVVISQLVWMSVISVARELLTGNREGGKGDSTKRTITLITGMPVFGSILYTVRLNFLRPLQKLSLF